MLAILLATLTYLSGADIAEVGVIEFYGLQTTSKDELRKRLGITEGDTAPRSLDDAVARLKAFPTVIDARLTTATCPEGQRTILYVGIREKTLAPIEFRPAPQGQAHLPEEVIQAGRALKRANSESRTLAGTSESKDLPADDVEVRSRLIAYAAQNSDDVRAVLRTSPDASERALAAEILGFVENKRRVTKPLVDALGDPAPEVRSASMRMLVAIAKHGMRVPRDNIKVPAAPIINLLGSLEWTDRQSAVAVLRSLTETRDPEVLIALRRHTAALEEMAQWHCPQHAHDAFVLLGRMRGRSNQEIRERWHEEPENRRFR